MGWSSAPDMTGANNAALQQAQLAKQQYDDYKQTFGPTILAQMNNDIDTSKRMTDSAIEGQQFQMGLAKKYDDRYWNTQVPQEDALIKSAADFDTAGTREQMASTAAADTEQAYGVQRANVARDAFARGADPTSGNYAALTQQQGNDQALASATAMTKTRQAAEQLGWSRRLDAASLEKGLAGFSSAANQAAQGWNGQAVSNAGAGLSAATGASSAANSAASTAGNLYQGAGQTYLGVAGIQQKAQDSANQMLGTAVGAGAGFM